MTSPTTFTVIYTSPVQVPDLNPPNGLANGNLVTIKANVPDPYLSNVPYAGSAVATIGSLGSVTTTTQPLPSLNSTPTAAVVINSLVTFTVNPTQDLGTNGVNWSCSVSGGGSCTGTITPNGNSATYETSTSTPQGTTITVTATAVGDPNKQSALAPFTVAAAQLQYPTTSMLMNGPVWRDVRYPHLLFSRVP